MQVTFSSGRSQLNRPTEEKFRRLSARRRRIHCSTLLVIPPRKGTDNLKTITYINAHKALVIPLVLGLMWHYHNWSTEAFIYLGIHGSYSLLWLVKEATYPDRRFEQRQPLWIGIFFVFLPLAGYYVAPYLLISGHVFVPPYVVGVVLFLFTGGIFFHYVADAQKYYMLELKPGLIEEGLFSRTRNPNYLGEILIYTSFALMSLHWLPFLILAGWVFGFFVRNMLNKDRSLSRYPQFAEYKKRTGLLFPKLF
jgi:protein-S-isoprenylcysteine O-methyltransferase Ste14